MYNVRNPDDIEAVILYIYLIGLVMIQEKVIMERTGRSLMLPQECRELFYKIHKLGGDKGQERAEKFRIHYNRTS